MRSTSDPKMTLAQALAVATATRFSGQKTGATSIQRAARAVRWLGEGKKAARVTPADARRMVVAMGAAGLSPASCNRHLSALAAVLEQAGVRIELPWQREPKGRTRWLTQAEVQHLAQACLPHKHGQAVAALVRFLAETGMRVGEALSLEWADLELEGARPHAKVVTSKNGDARWVPLTEEAARIARTRTTPDLRGPWFGLSQSTVNHVFRAAREAVASTAGDPEVVVHTLRHTAASRLVRAGVSLPVVSAWLGHRDFRSTLRYTHVDEQGLTNAARMLQDAR